MMFKPLLLALAIALAIPAANADEMTPGVQFDNSSLQELQEMHYYKDMPLAGEDDLANKRHEAMHEAAMAVGAQNGYVSEMNKLRRQFNADSKTWDMQFPFKDVMRLAASGEKSLYFLPPVIHESNDVTAHSDDNNRIKVSGKYYDIVKKERLVTAPPDWREYLLIDLPVDVSKPVGALLPKTPQEQQLWSDWISEGWESGVLQANAEMTSRIRNLGSDINGMIRYLRLVKERKIEPSYVASQYMGRVNSGDRMHLSQRTFAITAPASFNGDEKQWVPLDLDPRGGYRTPDEVRAINQGK